MKLVLSLLLIMTILLACVASSVAQTPGQPAANPGQPAATQPGQPGTEATPQRGSSFEYIVAFTGAALVLLLVCYPSRRY